MLKQLGLGGTLLGMTIAGVWGAVWAARPVTNHASFPGSPRQFVKYAGYRNNNPVFDPDLNWRVHWTFTAHEPLQQASIANGMIYVSGDGGNRQDPWDNRIYAVDARTGHLLWSRRLNNMSMTTPVVAANMVFVGTGTQQFQGQNLSRENRLDSRHITRGTGPAAIWALNARTGSVLWRYATRGEDMPSFVYSHDHLYCANGQGEVYDFNARTGQLDWSRSIGSYVSMSSPVLGPHGTLYVSGAHPYAIYAINTRNHQIRWRRVLPHVFAGSDDSGLSYAAGRIAVEGTIGSWQHPESALFCLDARTGAIIYRRVLGSGLLPTDIEVSAPVIVHDRIYVGSPLTGQEYAYDLFQGKRLWSFTAAGPISASVAVTPHTLYVGDERGFLYALDPHDGRERGSRYLSGVMAADYPIVVGKTLYEPDENGQLFAIDRAKLLTRNQHHPPTLPMPAGILGHRIREGEAIFMRPWRGGQGLSCESCHIAGGTLTTYQHGVVVPSLLGAAAGYPTVVNGQVRTLDEQINRCLKSMGGAPLSSHDPRLQALNVYLRWLASGWPVALNHQVQPIQGTGGGCQ